MLTEEGALVAETSATVRPITILINNADVHSFGTVQGDSLANFRCVQEINVHGAFMGINTVAPVMAGVKGGVIINVSSTCGIIGYGDQAAYVTSKWAVRGLTRLPRSTSRPTTSACLSSFPGGRSARPDTTCPA